MTIEFVKETKINGDEIFYTNIDGEFIPNSLSSDRNKAYNIYKRIVKNKGVYDATEVLQSEEV